MTQEYSLLPSEVLGTQPLRFGVAACRNCGGKWNAYFLEISRSILECPFCAVRDSIVRYLDN